jgi:hypothetical protein
LEDVEQHQEVDVMVEQEFKKELLSAEGAHYSLLFSPQSLYHFSSKGNTPTELLGGFSGLNDALTQWDRYNARVLLSLEVKRVDVTDVELDTLSTKIQLLSYAEANGIEVSDGMTNPKQLKKFLKTAEGTA